jgi:hypothetical protein
MYISYGNLITMLICATVMAVMLALLFVANHTLLRENRYLKGRLKSWRKHCNKTHAALPF